MRIAFLTTDNRENDRNYSLSRPYFGTAPAALLQGFALESKVEVHVISCLQQVASSPKQVAPNIWFHALHVPKFGWLRTGYQGCIRATRRELCEIKPDLVHGQGTERNCALSAVFSGYPNVVTIHGNMRLIAKVNGARPFSYQWLAGRLEGLTVPRSDGVICISRYTQDAISREAKRTWVLPNAVDADFFEITRKTDPIKTILCVGYVQRRKNFNALIRALDPMARRHRFKLIFAGHFSNEEDYVEEFRELLLSRNWCEHVGFADRASLREYLADASVLVVPSLEENCPMVILEAMAAGVPVVAARVGGIPELIHDSVTGLLCDPTDGPSIHAALEKMLFDAEFSTQIGLAAREDARQRFHPRVVASRHLDIYREVVNL